MKMILGSLIISLGVVASSPSWALSESYSVTGKKIDLSQSSLYVVMVEGALGEGIADAVLSEVAKANADQVIIELNSPGGYLREAEKLMTGIRENQKRGVKINTFVPNGSSCGSACTIIFLAGEERIVGDAASLMVHGVQRESMRGFLDNFMTSHVLEIYKERGVSENWIADLKTKGVFSRINDYWFSGREAVREDVGFATRSLGSIVEHTPPPFDPQIRSR